MILILVRQHSGSLSTCLSIYLSLCLFVGKEDVSLELTSIVGLIYETSAVKILNLSDLTVLMVSQHGRTLES